jgi:NhaP-type Na+/H+ or K+/H+ antiporter
LKNVGASPKLTILIVGESLLNDGSAMVLFTIFFNCLNGKTYTAGGVVGFAFAAALGSIVFGIFCGLVCVRWLRTAHRPLKESDVTMQIGMTICCAYLTFYIAQYTFGISGVLACCGAGAMIAWLGPPIILNHETMHNVWGMAEWALNTMIFLLSGLIIGHKVLSKVNPLDWFYMIFFYFFLNLFRALTIFLLYPFISKIGHRCTRQEAVFMSWAGLRGALAMALALIVQKDGPHDLSNETSRLFFYVGGIAALSLLINAITAKSVLYKLGLLSNNSAEKLLVTSQIKKKLRKEMSTIVSQMSKEFSFTEKDWEEVRMSCSLLQEESSGELMDLPSSRSPSLSEKVKHPPLLENPMHRRSDNINPKNSSNGNLVGLDLSPNNSRRNSPVPGQEQPQQQQQQPTAATAKKMKPFTIITGNNTSSSPRGNDHIISNSIDDVVLSRSSSFNDTAGGGNNTSSNNNNNNQFSRALTITFGTTTSQAIQDSNQLRLKRIGRLLSQHERSGNVLNRELLSYIRSIYFEIVRVKYWQFIESGKLPRLSFAAQFLLYTIEVAVDNANMNMEKNNPKEVISTDWLQIESTILFRSKMMKWLHSCEKYLPWFCSFPPIVSTLSFLETRKEKREVYVLTSFIQAHEEAQSKIHSFLRYDDDDDDDEIAAGNRDIRTMEEEQIIEESKRAVRKKFSVHQLIPALNYQCFLFFVSGGKSQRNAEFVQPGNDFSDSQ